MSLLPLYDTLIKGAKKTDLTDKEKRHLLNSVSQLSPDDAELFYMLILTDERNYRKKKASHGKLPYKGKSVPSKQELKVPAIQFDINNFPIRLRQVLYKFIELNSNKITELAQRPNIHSKSTRNKLKVEDEEDAESYYE